MKKLMTVLLTVMMAFSVLTVNVLADTETPVAEMSEEKTEIIKTEEEQDQTLTEINPEVKEENTPETEEIIDEVKDETTPTNEIGAEVEKEELEIVEFGEANEENKKLQKVEVRYETSYEVFDEVKITVGRVGKTKNIDPKYYDIKYRPNFELESEDANATYLPVGSWTATVTLNREGKKHYYFDEDHKPFEDEIHFEVTKKQVDVPEVLDGLHTYNGNEQSLSVEDYDTDIIEANGIWSATNAGTYFAFLKLKYPRFYEWKEEEITLTDSEDTARPDPSVKVYRWVIEKAHVELNKLVQERYYTGKELEPFAELPAGVTYAKRLPAWGDYDNHAKNAGYYVALMNVDTKNVICDDVRPNMFGYPVRWQIKKAQITVQFNITRTYGNLEEESTYNVTSPIGTVPFDVYQFVDEHKDTIFAVGPRFSIRMPAGVYEDRVKTVVLRHEYRNYIVNGATGDYTIKPATLGYTIDNLTYNGHRQTPKIQFTGLAPWDHIGMFDYVAIFTDAPSKIEDYAAEIADYRSGANINLNFTSKDVGTKNVIIGLFGDIAHNYELDNQTVIPTIISSPIKFANATYQITPAELTIEVDNAKMYKKKALPNFNATVKGLVGREDIQYDFAVKGNTAVKGECAITVENIKIVEPGNRIVNPDNYNITIKDGTLTVKDEVRIVSTGIE